MQMKEKYKPVIAAFCCNWCSYAGADLAGTSRLSYPANVKIIKVPCSCRVNPMFILRAFRNGADGVILCGCHPGDCHYSTGNYYARRRMTILFSLLDYLGVEQGRTRVEWVSAAEGVKFSQVMNAFVEKVTELGPNVRLADIRHKEAMTDTEVIQAVKGPKLRAAVSAKLTKADLLSAAEEMEAAGSEAAAKPEVSASGASVWSSERLTSEMRERAAALLEAGTVQQVLAWKMDESGLYPEPAYFHTKESLKDLVYNGFCAANLSKYLIAAGKKEGKTLAFLKPCDTYSYNQLLNEHRVERDRAYLIGIGCRGTLDKDQIAGKGIKGIESVQESEACELKFQTLYGEASIAYDSILLERCRVCKGKTHQVFDELLDAEASKETTTADRFMTVEKLEAMTAEERFAFWQEQLSKCIRCNACRNVCPACSCRKCVFDGPSFDSAQKANVTSFEEDLYHIIRAFHVAGRCTDCGECSRVCPQGIPIHLLNRKIIKDINAFYGSYQAGADPEAKGPLTEFTMDDREPNE